MAETGPPLGAARALPLLAPARALVLALTMLGGCAGPDDATTATGSAPSHPEVRVLEGCGPGGHAPAGEDGVVSEPTEWPTFWRRTCASDVPAVDFKRDLVLWHSWGTRSGSDAVRLEGTRMDADELVLRVTHVASECPTKDLRLAALFVAVDRHAFGTYRFEAEPAAGPCGGA